MYVLDQSTDMQLYYFAVSVIILSADGKLINRIVHKEAPYCRFAEADPYGNIQFCLLCQLACKPSQTREIEKIPLLNMRDPLGDLKVRMDRSPTRRPGGNGHRPANENLPSSQDSQRRDVNITRFLTGRRFYEEEATMRNG